MKRCLPCAAALLISIASLFNAAPGFACAKVFDDEVPSRRGSLLAEVLRTYREEIIDALDRGLVRGEDLIEDRFFRAKERGGDLEIIMMIDEHSDEFDALYFAPEPIRAPADFLERTVRWLVKTPVPNPRRWGIMFDLVGHHFVLDDGRLLRVLWNEDDGPHLVIQERGVDIVERLIKEGWG